MESDEGQTETGVSVCLEPHSGVCVSLEPHSESTLAEQESAAQYRVSPDEPDSAVCSYNESAGPMLLRSGSVSLGRDQCNPIGPLLRTLTVHTPKKASILNSFQIETYSMKYCHFVRARASRAQPRSLPVQPAGARDIRPPELRRQVPRLFNLALSMGFERGKILPSVAFCSDETQGYPTIIIAKHFSCFPFMHGQVSKP